MPKLLKENRTFGKENRTFGKENRTFGKENRTFGKENRTFGKEKIDLKILKYIKTILSNNEFSNTISII